MGIQQNNEKSAIHSNVQIDVDINFVNVKQNKIIIKKNKNKIKTKKIRQNKNLGSDPNQKYISKSAYFVHIPRKILRTFWCSLTTIQSIAISGSSSGRKMRNDNRQATVSKNNNNSNNNNRKNSNSNSSTSSSKNLLTLLTDM